MPRTRSRSGLLAGVAFLVVLAVPIWWGMDPSFSWDVDAIAPGPVLKGLAAGFAPGWQSSYGPLPYYLTAALYVPLLAVAKLTGELARPATTYPFGFQHPEFWMAALILAARALTLAMAAAFAWSSVRRERAAGHAASSLPMLALLAGSPTFVFYARTSNVDLHYLFWIGLGFVLVESPGARWGRLAAGAAAAAAAVCSKEQVLPLALMVILAGAIRAFRPGNESHRAGLRASIGIVGVAAATYCVLWRLPWNIDGFLRHHEFLVYEARYPRTYELTPAGVLGLARACLERLPVALGWPVLLGLVIAPFARIRVADLMPRAAGILLYLGAFLLSIGYVYPRFLLPALLLALPVASRAWESVFDRAGPSRPWVVAAFVALVFTGGPALDLVMLGDSRHRVEARLAKLPAGTNVEVLGSPRFQARVPRHLTLRRTSVDSLMIHPRGPQGDVVLISHYDTAVSDLSKDATLTRVYWDSLTTHGRYARTDYASSPLSRLVGGLPVDPDLTVFARTPLP